MTFNIFNILIIAGIIQGFIFTGIVCYNKKYQAKSTYYLVALIFIYSVSNLIYILPEIGLLPFLTMYNYLFIPIASIIPPIIYFYVIHFLYPSKTNTIKEKLLFVPFIVIFLFVLWFRLRVILDYDLVTQLNDNYRTVILFNELFSIIYSLIILIYIFIKIYYYEKKNKKFDKKIIRPDIKWLKLTLLTIFVSTFYWCFLAIKNIFITKGEVNFYYLWIIVAILVYWLGHIGIYKYGILSDRKKIRGFLEANELNVSKNTTSNYTSEKHSNEYILALKNLLIHDKIYLDSNLTLELVAEKLQLSPSYLSRIINSELNISFPDYLNSFRVNEAKNYLKNPEFSKYTIIAIGLEAGFNSKSSFYEVFKKNTGKTPLAYKKAN